MEKFERVEEIDLEGWDPERSKCYDIVTDGSHMYGDIYFPSSIMGGIQMRINKERTNLYNQEYRRRLKNA